jgi:hypothetical protein
MDQIFARFLRRAIAEYEHNDWLWPRIRSGIKEIPEEEIPHGIVIKLLIGLRYQKRAIYAALQSLLAQGVINRTSYRSGKPVYEIDPSCDFSTVATWRKGKRKQAKEVAAAQRPKVAVLSPAKVLRPQAKPVRPPAKLVRPVARAVCITTHTLTNEEEQPAEKNKRIEPPSPEGAQRALVRRIPFSEGNGRSYPTMELIDFWHAQLAEHFPQAPRLTLTAKDIKLFRDAFVDRVQNHDPREFIEVVVSQWNELIATEFGWIKGERPHAPSIKFVLRFLDRFVDALVRHKDPTRSSSPPRSP